MNEMQLDRFAKLANLRVELKSAEKAAGLETLDLTLELSRENLVGAIDKCNICRFDLGRVLSRYGAYFKADQHWLDAVKLIAPALHCSERTVLRILEEYDPASKLSETFIEAMKEQSIDPAAGKNAGLVTELLQMPAPESREEAGAIVAEKRQKQVAKKGQKNAAARRHSQLSRDVLVTKVVKLIRHGIKNTPVRDREAEVRQILELVVNQLEIEFAEPDQAARPDEALKEQLENAA